MVVVEAAARGHPEHRRRRRGQRRGRAVEEGVNGFVAASAEPEAIAEAIVRVHEAGVALRESTARWFARERAAAVARESSLRRCSRATRDAKRARVAVERQPRGALPGELRRASEPFAREARGERAVRRAAARSPRRSPARRAGRTAAPRRRRPRAARRRSSRRPARRAPSPPAPAARSPRTARGTRTRRASAHRPSSSSPVSQPCEAHVLARPRARRHARAAPPRARWGSRAAPAAAGARRRSRASASSSASRFLCGRLADRLSSTRRSPSSKRARVCGAPSSGLARATAPSPSGHDVDALAADVPSSSTRSRAGALRDRDHPLRAAHGRAAPAPACRGRAGRRAPRESARRSGRGRSRRAGRAPTAGAVVARLCTRSTPARAASTGSSVCSPSTHCSRRRAWTGTVTAGSSSPQGPSPAAAASRLMKAVKRDLRQAPPRAARGSARARRPPSRRSRRARGRSGSDRRA